jgi:hypothetical protein
VSKRQLISRCETRFLERHTAVVTFRQLFGFVAKALQEIKLWTSASAAQSASSLYASMHQFEFVVGLVILRKFGRLLLPVSRKLQAVENDLTHAIKDVTEALSALGNIRSETGCHKIFAEANLLAEHHGIAMSRPRLSRRGSTIGDAGDASPHRLNQKILQPLNYGRRAQTDGPSAS